MSPLLFLVALLPPEQRGPPPFVGQRVRWPGAERDVVWDGEQWVQDDGEPPFDGGDSWLGPEEW